MKFVVKHFTDATQQGDRDASWLAEGEVRKCLNASLSCRPLAPRDDALRARAAARSGRRATRGVDTFRARASHPWRERPS